MGWCTVAQKGAAQIYAGTTVCLTVKVPVDCSRIDKTTFEIENLRNPVHPGNLSRNCAKGPATHNQIYDPERILYPLKRVGKRGEGKWRRVSWDEALDDIAAKMRASREKRRDGIMYHVGRPGEDHYTNRIITAWGVDAHNSHTNICSASSRLGYYLWAGFDRPSPDYANADCILLISSHLETGHYFNPHAQRIIEAKERGATLITMDPRMSNTASKSDIWLPTWPGSETTLLLAIANYMLQNNLHNRAFMKRWVDWEKLLETADRWVPADVLASFPEDPFSRFEATLKHIYAEFTFERAAEECQVPIERIRAAAEAVSRSGQRLATHNWRAASIGNKGGWQVTRCLLFLNVLTGSIGTEGGTSGNSWNKFVLNPTKRLRPLTYGMNCTCQTSGHLRIMKCPFSAIFWRKVAAISMSISRGCTTPCGLIPMVMWHKSNGRGENEISCRFPTWNECLVRRLCVAQACRAPDQVKSPWDNGLGFGNPYAVSRWNAPGYPLNIPLRPIQERSGRKMSFGSL